MSQGREKPNTGKEVERKECEEFDYQIVLGDEVVPEVTQFNPLPASTEVSYSVLKYRHPKKHVIAY
jgi:hypothetical protein